MTTRAATTQYRLSQWAEIMKDRIESGENITKYCESHGIKRDRFFYWQRRLRQAASEHFEGALGGQTTSLSVPGFAKLSFETPKAQESMPQKTDAAGGLQVEIGDVRISVGASYPPDKLAELLRGLRQC